ncbi:NYN domain-containing protein [Hylemonella gracilis]|nr:NYN domain-containing protein [Hylemonella gracilis]
MDDSLKLHLFVDNSNVLIEARRHASMKRRGKDKLDRELDDAYEVDWGKFLFVVKSKGNRPLAQVPVLYGSRPPPEDTIWQRIRDEGFDVKLFDRNIRNKEKGVDMEMGMDVVERVLTVTPAGKLVLACGDADFIPVISRAKKRGWHVEVWFWSNAAEAIKKEASEFCVLDKYLPYLRIGGGVALPP